MPLTVAVDVPAQDREVHESWLRAPSARAGLVQRARIVLLAADEVAVKDIVQRVRVSKPTVIGWKKRYAAEGLDGLEDQPKPGRRRVVDEAAVVTATLEPPPRAARGDTLVLAAAGRRADFELYWLSRAAMWTRPRRR